VGALGVAACGYHQTAAPLTILVTAYQPLWPPPTHEMYIPSRMFNCSADLTAKPSGASLGRPRIGLAGYGRRPQGFAQSRYQRCTPG